nr:reverse transcriptase domain-containing protein [Tanacetum cinerariifolium]
MMGLTSEPVTPVNQATRNNDNPNNSPSLQDQILDHVSSLKALIKQHNERCGTLIEPIRLSFGDEDGSDKGKGISCFMNNSKCPDLARQFSNQVQRKHAASCCIWGGQQRTYNYNNFNNHRDYYQPYVLPRANNRRYDNRRHENNHLSMDALTKRPKEILATKLQLQLPPCPPMVGAPKKENLDRYCDYHGEKGHYTNVCYQLKRELEIALEFEKLSHLVKYVGQRGNAKGRKHENNNGKVRARLTQTQTELVGLSREQLIPIGKIEPEIAFENKGLCQRTMMKFTVVRALSPHNIILGRTRMRDLRAVLRFLMSTFGGKTNHAGKEGEEKQPERQKNPTEEEILVNPAFLKHKLTIRHRSEESWVWIRAWSDGFRFKCFLDAYKGYHQIQMAEEDEEKTTFYTDHENYCYAKMSFGLKNTDATYHRLVDSAFQPQLYKNLEAYVDDMVIKSKTEQEMIMDIAEIFDNLQKINMK